MHVHTTEYNRFTFIESEHKHITVYGELICVKPISDSYLDLLTHALIIHNNGSIKYKKNATIRWRNEFYWIKDIKPIDNTRLLQLNCTWVEAHGKGTNNAAQQWRENQRREADKAIY